MGLKEYTFPTIRDQIEAYRTATHCELRAMKFKPPKWYKWSADPVHHWSRIWEYPYVFSRLIPGTVLDAGAGVTPFDDYMRSKGHEVTVLDSNPRIAQHTNGICGDISDHTGQYDNVVCVSVLEHMEDPQRGLDNLLKCVKPGGRLICTIDIDPEPIDGGRHKTWFPFTDYPDITDGHILNSRNAPIGRLPGPTYWLKRQISKVKRLHPLGHIPLIAVCGFVMEKTD